MKKKGIKQADLAGTSGVDTATISRILSGEVKLISVSLPKVAAALGITPAQLLAEYPEMEIAPPGTRRVPVWDYVQAGKWAGVAPNLRGEEMQDHVLTDVEYSNDAFAMVIRGDSMEPDFHEGEVVIIDPAVRAKPGDFVVAKDDLGEATFKKFRPRGMNDKGVDYFILEPLNQDYEPMRSDLQLIKIIGTMVEHRRYRKR